ncbi:hypothetical protein ANO14919_062570 [Xylariales sp. No.14919]|nr:hypothetical protein ANO14919_062570 [Xylariales sp. No.14919]
MKNGTNTLFQATDSAHSPQDAIGSELEPEGPETRCVVDPDTNAMLEGTGCVQNLLYFGVTTNIYSVSRKLHARNLDPMLTYRLDTWS